MPGRVVGLGVLLVNFSEISSAALGWVGSALVRVSARSGAFCCSVVYLYLLRLAMVANNL